MGGKTSKECRSILNSGEEDQVEIFGYRRNPVKLVLTWISIICTCGIVRLIFYWMRHWMLQCTHSLCTLEHADYVLLKNTYDQWFVCKVKSLRTDAERARRTAATEQRPSVPSVSESVDSSVVYPKENGKFEGVDDIRYFDDRRIRYIWNTESKAFVRLLGLDQHLSAEYFQTCSPLNSSEVQQRRLLYQSNEINIEVSPIIKILFKEVLNPFYIFQIFSISLWFSYGYYYYAGAILITTLCSLALTVHQLRKMQQMLQERAHAEETVTVCRPGAQTETVGSEQLVPGDIIQIPALGCQVLCDVILIAGSAIVNESALTGESVPVTKTAIPDCSGPFGIKEYQRHMVFSGTRVLQTRYYANEPVRAVVLRTGFATNKGNLIRSIMYPKPVDFKFYRHTYYFIIVLAAIALCGLIYSAILRAMRGQAVSEIIIRSLDVITIAVPPALPAALSVGIIYAQRRLQKNRIFCLSPRSINICGSVNLICFDKTGTLTQDGLDMKCVLPSQKSSFEEAITNPKEMPSSRIKDCMVACHSLTVIQGQTCGDPVDLIMFNSLSWSLMEPDVNEEARFDLVAPTLVTGPKCDTESDTIGIIKDFPFASSLQRMSTVIRRVKDEEFSYLMKGSPEKVITLCLPDTVPDNYFEQLESFTRHGDRVLALAWKPLNKMRLVKIQKLLREDLDKEMIFLGFVVMENRLKTDTKSVLEQIHNANIRTVMVTGDNMHTAISVARDCGMIRKWDDVHIITAGETNVFWTQAERPVQSFSLSIGSADKISSPTEIINLPTIHGAVSGESFSRIRSDHPQVLKKMLAHGTVFARMSPNEKERLVEDFQEAGYFVAMCGDGANDCGALKAAHAGVSLSESEAAAAAPFTACTGSIGCVPEIIKEGRAALVTSFGIFKYMAGYSLTQFFSVIVLYSIATNFSDLQFTYVDIFQVLILSATFGRSKAHPHLSRTPPPTSLITFVPLFSLFSQVIIVFGFQLAAFFIAYLEKDSTSYENMYANGGGTPPFFSKENFAVFAVSSFQYVWLALAFAKGPPYRKILLKNRIFCLTALGMVAFDMFLLLGPTEPMKWLLELQVPELWNRKLTFLFLAFCNGIIAILFEKIVVDYVIFRKLGTRFKFLRNVRTHQDVTRDLLNTMPDDWWHELERKPLE
ncbi:polyamine-transporting ATPase 13A3-like isoform X2 [Paramacrobiotus metropolitanus]|uniref:polyamine-transporting ATPase 13A3-like isoform X2 n=1 Tax=Paramacrobiotus metropolitanus TaxID=2943436 RepID=UPI002445EE89|nr:polyamine-transporting ATPase 13A3-like isoform X2 [Paramacrobiotus metropolitanus]